MQSRISHFFEEFVNELKSTNINSIFITDIFTAREKAKPTALASDLAKAIGPKALYTGTIEKTAAIVSKNIKDYDVVCSMGAGNSYKLFDLINK